MKIYIASAMFTERQQTRINKQAKYLRELGHEVYVPHELKIENADNLSNNDWAHEVFTRDVKAIDEANVLFYFCEGMEGDIGAAWECGYAYAKGKRIIVYELQDSAEISLMVAQSSNSLIESYQS